MKVMNISFIKFVYPILFEAEKFDALNTAIGQAAWPGAKRALPVWEIQEFPQEEMLMPVVDFLTKDARLWTLTYDARTSPRGLGCGANTSWFLRIKNNEVQFSIDDVQFFLFPVGVGFVTITAHPLPGNSQWNDWLDFLYYFRKARPQHDKVEIRATLRKGIEPENETPIIQPYFPSVAGGLEQHPDGAYLKDILDALLKTASPENWWSEVFSPGQLVPFACFFVEGIEESQIEPHLYQLRYFYPAHRKPRPPVGDLSTGNPAVLPYEAQQWFFFSLDGGGYFGCNPPDEQFFKAGLDDHLKKQYFLLFIIALQQRFALVKLLKRAADEWPAKYAKPLNQKEYQQAEIVFGDIRNQMLCFTGRGYYAQPMQHYHHQRAYQKWQDAFQIERLYAEVRDEILYMHDTLQSNYDRLSRELEEKLQKEDEVRRKETEAFQGKISLFALLFLIPSLLLAVLDAVGGVSWLIAIITLFAGLIIAYLLYRRLNRRVSRAPSTSNAEKHPSDTPLDT